MGWSRRAGVVGVAGLLVWGGAWQALAQQPGAGAKRTLHEYFQPGPVPASAKKGAGAEGAVKRTMTRRPQGPPALTLDVKQDELVLGADGPVNDQRAQNNPQGNLDPMRANNALDSRTDRVDELNYFSSFDPSVIPYKRGVAQNSVVAASGGTYRLVVQPGALERVGVAAVARQSGEDAFWGTFALRADGSGRYPIPSVSPDQRVLQVVSEPKLAVEVVRDQAGNFYLTTGHKGLLRVNMLVAVPRFYFDGAMDQRVSWAQLDRELLTMPALPAEARRAAQRVLQQIGISRASAPHMALRALVQHFRDFQAAPFPDQMRGEDLYVSIATRKIGVCRHRSFAFVITALALGIPARYVYNEAHAFVEVKWPGQGWRRIDLGGAADELLMRATAREERVHDGAVQDSLPQPPAYVKEMERMAQMEQAARRDLAKAPGAGNGPGAGDPKAGNGPGTPGDPDGGGEEAMSVIDDAMNVPYDAVTDPIVTPSKPSDRRRRVNLSLRAAQARVLRGQPLAVRGTMHDADVEVGRGARPPHSKTGKVVKLYLGPVGAPQLSASSAQLVGTATLNAEGAFEATVQIPAELPIGRWTLKAVFEGDDRHQPAESP